MTARRRGVLGIVGTGAGGVEGLRTALVEPAMGRGWQVAVTLTPTAGRWLHGLGEVERLEQLTGLPVRDQPRRPGEPRPLSPTSRRPPDAAEYARDRVSARAANEAETSELGLVDGVRTPVLVVEHVVRDANDRPLEFAEAT